MRNLSRCLVAAILVTAAGCQTNGLSRQDWFPLAQKKSSPEQESSVAELIPAAGRPTSPEQMEIATGSDGHVANARIDRLVDKTGRVVYDGVIEPLGKIRRHVSHRFPDRCRCF